VIWFVFVCACELLTFFCKAVQEQQNYRQDILNKQGAYGFKCTSEVVKKACERADAILTPGYDDLW